VRDGVDGDGRDREMPLDRTGKNAVTISATATRDSTSEWKELEAQVTLYIPIALKSFMPQSQY
jgi:hypothetical protein